RCCNASATSATLFGHRRYRLGLLTPARSATRSIVSRAYPTSPRRSAVAARIAASTPGSRGRPRPRGTAAPAGRACNGSPSGEASSGTSPLISDDFYTTLSGNTAHEITKRIRQVKARDATRAHLPFGGPLRDGHLAECAADQDAVGPVGSS